MEANEDVIRFTAKELLARLDVKLDELKISVDGSVKALDSRVSELEKQNAREEGARKQLDDHESRLRSLEKRVIILSVGAAAAGGTGGQVIGQLLGF